MNQISVKWKIFFENKGKRKELYYTLLMLALILFLLTRFLNYIEKRNGIIPGDPIHNVIPPVDLTWLTFVLIYASLVIAVYYLLQDPERLLFAVHCYIIMVVFRIVAMYLVPFNPPPAMIPLADPFAEYFGTGQMLTRDLFFSGHTATLFILYLTAENKILKLVFLLCTILVAIAVIFQHVHYTVDVLGALLFTYCSFLLVKKRKASKEQSAFLRGA